MQSVNCCHTCGKVAAKMALCSKCSHATFCDKACLAQGWKAHKPLCTELQAILRESPIVAGKRKFCHTPYLEDALQVRPQAAMYHQNLFCTPRCKCWQYEECTGMITPTRSQAKLAVLLAKQS